MDTSGVRFPPPLIYLAGLGAGALLEIAWPTDWLSSGVAVPIAAISGVAWLVLDGGAMVAFGRAKTSMDPRNPSTRLVTAGPYRVTRNPMYVGMAFLYVALALAFGIFWALALLPLVLVLVDRVVIAREEPYLARTFGNPYLEYSARVRRWL